MKIAVAGAGWFGCHVAAELIAAGDQVTVFEREGEMFRAASGSNQNRLHRGFHYPRSYETRIESQAGFVKFKEKYPNLSSAVKLNIYAVADRLSSLDFETYLQIMDATRLEYSVTDGQSLGLQNISGAIVCDERLVETSRARKYFMGLLHPYIRMGVAVNSIERVENGVLVNGERYDALIDCTWGSLGSDDDDLDCYFEPVIMFLYQGSAGHPAITIMDGPFFSIYPYENDIYSLSSVTHTPIGQYATHGAAKKIIDQIGSELVSERRQAMESEVAYYFPEFGQTFKHVGHQTAVKLKLNDASATRGCIVHMVERTITVTPGKIDSIFYAYDEVAKHLSTIR